MRTTIAVAAALAASLASANAQEQLTCTNSGNTYEVGQVACVSQCHSQQTRLARCEQKPYGATWIYLSENCPSAGLPPTNRVANWIVTATRANMTPMPASPLPALSRAGGFDRTPDAT